MADVPVTDINKLDRVSQQVMEANAKSQGITAQEYLTSRGGVYASGYYGDTPEFRRLDDSTYAEAAKSGSGAINSALNAKKRAAFIADPSLIEDPYMRMAFQSGRATIDDVMNENFNQRNNTITKSQTSSEEPIMLKSSSLPATPVYLPPPTPTPPKPPAKTAPIDTVLFEDDSISPEIMIDLVFEDIGGHELLSISRNDIVNGQRISYSPIKNLGLIQQTYNPNNLFSLQKTSDKYFANFSINFDEKVPEEGNGENGVNVYIEEATGDLIIETINMNNDEQVESEIAINGTIYEANFGETVS